MGAADALLLRIQSPHHTVHLTITSSTERQRETGRGRPLRPGALDQAWQGGGPLPEHVCGARLTCPPLPRVHMIGSTGWAHATGDLVHPTHEAKFSCLARGTRTETTHEADGCLRFDGGGISGHSPEGRERRPARCRARC